MKNLVDPEDGENRAVRTFLMYYGASCGITTNKMRRFLSMAGFKGAWPEWANKDMHLTKSGAQNWIRHLFALEASTKPTPLRGPTNYVERFTQAVAILCGAQPPADMVNEWIANVDVNGEHRLQGWVLSQAATPSWAQGIVVLDAADVLANDPEEGAGHTGLADIHKQGEHK
jgi:hypothetical protein